jgi:hypothetical protein
MLLLCSKQGLPPVLLLLLLLLMHPILPTQQLSLPCTADRMLSHLYPLLFSSHA